MISYFNTEKAVTTLLLLILLLAALPAVPGAFLLHSAAYNNSRPASPDFCYATITLDDYPSGSAGEISWGNSVEPNGQQVSSVCGTQTKITGVPYANWNWFSWTISSASIASTVESPTTFTAGSSSTTITAYYIEILSVSGTDEFSSWPVVSSCQVAQTSGDPIYDPSYGKTVAPNDFDNCIVFAANMYSWDALLLKAQIGYESNYNWMASNSNNGCSNGWASFGLMEVSPCYYSWFGQKSGVLNTETNQQASDWNYSSYNPAYNMWGGMKILSSDYSSVKSTFSGCNSNEYIYLALADYNQGLTNLKNELTGCVLNQNTGGYNYDQKILSTDTATGGPYSSLCASISGCTDPYTGFPSS